MHSEDPPAVEPQDTPGCLPAPPAPALSSSAGGASWLTMTSMMLLRLRANPAVRCKEG
jgi:hypothetical protein